jgi:glycogen operon protein
VRGAEGFDPPSAFLATLRQDPVLARCKLVAEPWDIGPGGYRLGAFPAGWQEWNDRYRDTMRRAWLHAGTPGAGDRAEFARRFAGSSDVFGAPGRRPWASVNFLCAHDGFTLHDLVSYNHKHNEANGEHNRDGHTHNLSWNCGHEGGEGGAEVQSLRQRLKRALLATLMLSQGTPMLLAGDELGHSQQGNNNAYCQDNALSWIDWRQADRDLTAYVAGLVRLRRALGVDHRSAWYPGVGQAGDARGIRWLRPDGNPLAVDDWHAAETTLMVLVLDGAHAAHRSTGAQERAEAPPAWLLIFNPAPQAVACVLPPAGAAGAHRACTWSLALDSAAGVIPERMTPWLQSTIDAPARGVLVMRACAEAGGTT